MKFWRIQITILDAYESVFAFVFYVGNIQTVFNLTHFFSDKRKSFDFEDTSNVTLWQNCVNLLPNFRVTCGAPPPSSWRSLVLRLKSLWRPLSTIPTMSTRIDTDDTNKCSEIRIPFNPCPRKCCLYCNS